LRNFCLFVIFLALLSVTIFIRIRTLSVPLERDEGEYAYAGQLILQGVPPYQLAYNMKMPGIYAAYAAIIAVFGQTASGIHFGVLLINTVTVILIFLLTKKLFNTLAGVAAATFFAITSLSRFVQATANAENFVVLPAIAAILLLVKFSETKKIWQLITAGLLMGVAFMMKQHAIGFIIFGGILLLLFNKPFTFKKLFAPVVIYSVCVVLPFLITCVILWHCGVFDKFWFWTFDYAGKYVSIVPLQIGLKMFTANASLIVQSAPLIWLAALLGFACIFWVQNLRKHWKFLSAFFVCSFISICPGMYFRFHYFLLLLPAVCILAGAAVFTAENLCLKIVKSQKTASVICSAVFIGIWLHTLFLPQNYYFENDPVLISRLTFGSNAFAEMREIADYIKQHSNTNDQIAVMGSEPEIFFYSQRRSASPYIYMYPLMEPQPYAHKMQQEMITHIEQNKPRFFVFVTNNFSWLQEAYSDTTIFKWFGEYIKNYDQLKIIEAPPESNRIYLFQRKELSDSSQ
jgi:4-amino-4-deoxy-L-arabinose transferase-like glycosyltransferase